MPMAGLHCTGRLLVVMLLLVVCCWSIVALLQPMPERVEAGQLCTTRQPMGKLRYVACYCNIHTLGLWACWIVSAAPRWTAQGMPVTRQRAKFLAKIRDWSALPASRMQPPLS